MVEGRAEEQGRAVSGPFGRQSRRAVGIAAAASGVYLALRAGVSLSTPGEDPYGILALVAAALVLWTVTEIAWADARLAGFGPVLDRLLATDGDEGFAAWYRNRHRRSFALRPMLATGAGMAVLLGVLFAATGLPFRGADPVVGSLDLAFFLATAFVGGMSQWAFYNILVTVTRLTRRELDPNLWVHGTDGIFDFARVLFKVWLGGMGLVVLAELAILGTGVPDPLPYHALVLLVGAGALVWFSVVQLRLHQVIVRKKKRRMREVALELEDRMTAYRDADELQRRRDLRAEIGDLHELYDRLSEHPEWPFRFFALRVMSSVVPTLVPPFLDVAVLGPGG